MLVLHSKFDRQMMLRQKAILRFLNLPEEEAASWRVKDAKDVSDLRQMTLEEKGDFLINKVGEADDDEIQYLELSEPAILPI